MTVQEVIEYLEQHGFIADEVKDMCIEALVQVEQYRALGTVEELKEAREKQLAKKPIWIKRSVTKFQVCPCCSNAEHYQMIFKSQKYCSECGQALKWGKEDD